MCKQIKNGKSFAKNIDTMTFDKKLQRIFNLISKITAVVVICRFLLMICSEGFRRGWMKLVQRHLGSPNCHRMPQMYACENHVPVIGSSVC